ncbi:hypothetical protein [Mycobacterium avium]|uniref:hypothetical protein n=1 Tax=Mycobacterium avium TaxID=1764 RepID=UPI0003D21530|nr:hypothetical protein [Mycobacterium avium]ETB28636.1 hypothetical protein O971_14260 [Mycobacterium avium subsp. hominissuis 10-4249]KDO95323.1 hypothetical protein MAVA5_13415 [Mycobacterium avium subsp. hominissuis A5]
MCQSTEITDARDEFAAEVLRKLLRRIDLENQVANPPQGNHAYLVSHAWTKGPMMYLVYTSPPSDITWGLARDTRESIIDQGPWPDADEAATYYFLLDLEEGCATSNYPREPGEILWCGYPLEDDLPACPSDIPDTYRITPSQRTSSAKRPRDENRPVVNEPRLYADPP